MKLLIYGFLISSMLVVSRSYADCSKVPGPDGAVPKCASAADMAAAALRLDGEIKHDWLALVLAANNYSSDELTKNCTIVQKESNITSISESSCQFPNGKNKMSNRVCQFAVKFKCVTKGFEVFTARNGSCIGQMHDCGTYTYCAEDQTKYICDKSAWLTAKKDSFHTDEAVPKNSAPQLSLPSGKSGN